MKIWMTIALVALAGPALAQEPTQQEKVDALKMAYRLNGNSMVGRNRMIDLTDPNVLAEYARLIAEDAAVAGPPVDPPKPVRTVAVQPVEPVAKADICRRHGKRKVATHGGRSWRCR